VRAIGVVILLLVAAMPSPGRAADARPVRIASTATLERSGLLAVLLPAFAQESGRGVRVLGRGPAQVAALGRRGEVDVVLASEGADADALHADGIARSRIPVFEARFVIAGPESDPAGVARAKTVEAAIGQIFRFRAPFVRRLDDSDVRERERALFKAAGVDSEVRWESLVEVTTGMIAALETAGEKRAYVIADLASFLASKEETKLVALSTDAKALRQTYSILQLDAQRVGQPIDAEGAFAFERFLVGPKGQALIRDFGREKLGEAVFAPLVGEGAR
jgi:tungstate transport system substrate-binding protein